MWIWPRRAKGFHVSLRAGLYVLPSHLAWADVRRLMWLLIEGMEEVKHGLELDWNSASNLATGLGLGATMSWIRAPGPSATLPYATRWCFVQYETPGIWPETAWYERHVKDPLVSFLSREFHDSDHPLRNIGIRNLPIDELAALTVDPVEVLVILEHALTHRARSSRGENDRNDWMRSIRRAAADRLAARLGSVPSMLLARALDLLLAHPNGLFSMLEDHEAAKALTHAGLVRYEGNDALVYPLARRIHAVGYIGRLVEKLPEAAWSDSGKGHVRDKLPRDLPILRPLMIMPDLPFGRSPVLIPVACLEQVKAEVRRECEEPVVARVSAGLDLLAKRCASFEGGASEEVRDALAVEVGTWRLSLDAQRAANERGLHWPRVVETCHRIVTDTGDHDEVRELGFELGFVGRFLALDDLLEDEAPDTRKLLALVRWMAVHAWLDHALSADNLDSLARVVEDALGFAANDVELVLALTVMSGDLAARRRSYRASLEYYERAMDGAPKPTMRSIIERRLASSLRLDDYSKIHELWGQFFPLLPAPSPRAVSIMALIVAEYGLTADIPQSLYDRLRKLGPAPVPNGVGELARIAWDTMAGEWPAAIHRARRLFEERSNISALDYAFVRLAWGWMKAVAGDVDVARDTFEVLVTEAETQGDRLLEATSRRGLALVAQLLEDHELAIDSLARALELEVELDMADAGVVAIELNIARFKAGQEIDLTFDQAFDDVPSHQSSVSLTAIVMSRMLCLTAQVIASTPVELPPTLLSKYTKLRSRNLPLLRSAIRQLLTAIITAHDHANFAAVITPIRQIAEDDQDLLAWLEAQRPHIDAMRVRE